MGFWMIKSGCFSCPESVRLNRDYRLLNEEKSSLVNLRSLWVLLKVNVLFIIQVLLLLHLSVPSHFITWLHA